MDEMAVGATYLLGREYIALGDTAKAIECYKPFLTGLRDSRLRVSALKLLAYHCGKSGKVDDAMEVYATLLDEYGKNAADSKGNPIPLPRKDRLRQGQTNWDGLRLPPPSDLDLGEIRYNLGYFFFKQQDWERGVVALAPFRDEAALRNSRHRDRALYMLAQSHFKRQEYAGGAQALQTLMREHPKFEALEEAYTYAARGYAEVRQWTELDMVYRRFVAEWPKSDYRPRMDYYNALSLLNQGKPDGIRTLRSMTDGDLFDDVRADAAWQAGAYYAAANPPNLQEAYRYLDKSVELYAREQACLELGKVCIKLRKWDRAQSVLQRLLREFPYGDRKYLGEAERLLPEVQRELARDKTK
jgi:tetratricopeptide (TPR) repeat protein